MSGGHGERAGVVARPPLIYLAFLVAGLGLDAAWPAPIAAAAVRYPAAVALAALGGAIAATAFRRFRRAGTPIQTSQPTVALVTDGPYRYSRNPIYGALTLIYLAIAIAANSAWALALAVPLLLVIRVGVIAREERYLEHRFGDAYRAYRGRVRRWL